MNTNSAATRRQSGFTLVEIAIVLVIIGLLLGGILKGQELINSARVRNMADMNAGIQAAYYGFIDRFRRVPGDWKSGPASDAIGVTITGGGNSNGRIDHESPPTGDPVDSVWDEPNALWEQLSKAGFIQGAYTGEPTPAPDTNSNQTPLNAFNNIVMMARTKDYEDENVAPVRLHLVLGRGVPVDIAQELDIKLDDGKPFTGVLRLAVNAAATLGELAQSDSGCAKTVTDATGDSTEIYDIQADVQDCNLVFLY